MVFCARLRWSTIEERFLTTGGTMRRARITATILVVVVAIVVGGFFYHDTHRSRGIPSRLTESQVVILEKGLNSRDGDEQAKILAQPLRAGYVQTNVPHDVTIDRASFAPDGMGAAHITVHAGGPMSVCYVLTLVRINNQWFIVSSVRS